jgi:MFS family permease
MPESSMRAHAGLRTRLGQPWGARTSFLVVAAVQATLFAGSNLPTPLFPLYERRYDFGSGVVTLLFVSYVAVLIPSMLTLGRLSDALGRRPVMIAGLALTGLSSLAFAGARNVGWLFAGEVAYGVAAGMVNSGVVAALRELHPEDSAAGGALGVTAAQVTGLLIGPLASGVLAATTPWPLVSPYALDIALVLALLGALAKVPETRPQVVRSRPPMFVVPHEIRAQFVPAVLVAAVGWMTAGWVFALSPLFLREQLDVGRPALAGAFAAVVLATNLATQVAFWRGRTERVQRLGLAVAPLGMAVVAASATVPSVVLAFVGAVVLGAGFGAVTMSSMAALLAAAPPETRGGVASAFLTGCYAALSVPVLVIGLVADHLGLAVVTGIYALALAALASRAHVATRQGQRWLAPAVSS